MTAPQEPYSSTPQDPYSSAPRDPYTSAPQDSYSSPVTPVRRRGAQIFSILAMVSGVVAIFILPILFGPIGIVLAVVANRRAEPLWKVALAVAIGGMILGFILAYVVLSSGT